MKQMCTSVLCMKLVLTSTALWNSRKRAEPRVPSFQHHLESVHMNYVLQQVHFSFAPQKLQPGSKSGWVILSAWARLDLVLFFQVCSFPPVWEDSSSLKTLSREDIWFQKAKNWDRAGIFSCRGTQEELKISPEHIAVMENQSWGM